MQQGQYIQTRLLPTFVRQAAKIHNIACESMSDDWVLRLSTDLEIRWVLGYQFDLNSAAASALTSDKVATYVALNAVGIDAARHVVLRSLPNDNMSDILNHLDFADMPFVIKPLSGTSGRGVQKVSNRTTAVAKIEASNEVAWAASPYYEIISEYRSVMLDDQTLLSYKKTHPVLAHGLKLFNLGMGAVATDVPDMNMVERLDKLSKQTCKALSLRAAAVDIIELADGSLLVLEVNGGIMMENYARQSDEYKARAERVYDAIVQAMFN